MTVKSGHFIVVPQAAWGHTKPLLHLTLNMLIAHPSLHISMLLAPSVSPRVHQELERSGASAPNDRLKFIEVASDEFKKAHPVFSVATMGPEAMEYAKVAPGVLEGLLGGQDNTAGGGFGARPSLMIFDVAKALNQSVIKLFAFLPSSAASTYHICCKIPEGDMIALQNERVAKAIAAGATPEEAWHEHTFSLDGKVIRVPGLPPMYDYEFFPQLGSLVFPLQASGMTGKMVDACRDPDVVAYIMPSVEEFEPAAHKALVEISGKAVLQTGLQFPESVWKGSWPGEIPKGDQAQVMTFLDDMLKKRGERSVAYVSFGSLFWPVGRPELAKWMVESLTEAGVPFVLAHATEMFPVDPELVASVEKNPLAIAVKFAPQMQVLAHPATRFFVCHCGSNSTAEAIVNCVPMVTMPFAADQGTGMALVTKLGIAIDLKQVKTFRNKAWTSLRDGTEIVGTEEAIKAEQRGVWAAMMGAKGDEMRARVSEVRAMANKSRTEGRSKETMEKLTEYF